MRTSVRRIALIGAFAALALVPALAAPAGAVEDTPPTTLGPCTFTVTPNPVPGFPADVTVTVNVPSTGVTVTVFVNGVANQDVIANSLQVVFTVHLTAPSSISVNYFTTEGNAYATGCTSGGALSVFIESAQAARQAAQALAFTGSNNTPSFVLIGVAALVVGLVLTVGARRRSRISS